MKIATLPADEELRLLDLHSYEILDSAPEREFDELVQLASHICDCPISVITFVDSDRQWFKARLGMEPQQTSRNAAFCAHTILADETMIIENALEDERFVDNPLVTGDPNICFYAGAPIVSPAGHRIGSICVIDNKPNSLTPVQNNALRILSNQITKLLELRRSHMLLRKRANDLIDLNNQTIQQAIQQKDESDKLVATELHEHIAQKVATCKLYLNMALGKDEEFRMNSIGWVTETLSDVITDIRNLSNSLLPSTLGSVPLQLLLLDFVDRARTIYTFKIAVGFSGKPDDLNIQQSITCFRIVEKWLVVLAKYNDVSNVTIHVSAKHVLDLQISDNGSKTGVDEMEQNLLTSTVYSRVSMSKGAVSYQKLTKGENVLLVKMPL